MNVRAAHVSMVVSARTESMASAAAARQVRTQGWEPGLSGCDNVEL